MSCVANEWRQAFDDCRGFVDYRLRVERLSSVSDNDSVRIFEIAFYAEAQHVGDECISESEPAAAGLIFVCRTNPTQRSADALVAETFFARVIERTMIRKNQVCA